jgi:hypothetical protein
MANRFTNSKNVADLKFNEEQTLLNIMLQEFPDDPLYSKGQLTAQKLTETAHPIVSPITDIKYTSRDSSNRIDVYADTQQYTEYKLDKIVPTASEDVIDDLLDEEWEYFVNEGQLREPTVSGLFLIPKEIQLNPLDFHDAYITRGPENLSAILNSNLTLLNRKIDISDIISNVFCVYYINNDVAYPIPNYKTLEVMLVERGLTYSSINEADNEQLRKFDMVFDGKFEGDQTPNSKLDPVEEFNFRKLPDRTIDWNVKVRFDSGYRPSAPFKRDPGDYLKPIGYQGIGASDLYRNEDPNDRYFDLVFQGQTYKEKLREKYEGKMVIDKWPVPYNNDSVVGNQSIVTDDLVLGVRLMINGYWKGIALASEGGSRVFETYAQINGYSLKDFQVGQGRYGERGYINLFLEQGGLTVLHVQEDERPSVVWDDFPHIAEINRLDPIEYLDYINNYSNNGQPFDIDYLNPYEPKGSIVYYNQVQLDKLQMEAVEQAAFDNIKEQIEEYWPLLATRVEEFKGRINNIQTDAFSVYFINMLGNNCPSYKILTADQAWKYVKKKKDGLKIKDEETNLLALFEKNTRISANFDRDEEDRIVSEGKWGKAWIEDQSKFGEAFADFSTRSYPLVNIYGLITGPIGSLLFNTGLINNNKYELPRNYDQSRAQNKMRSAAYVKAMIAKELEERITAQNIYDRIDYADSVIAELRTVIDEAGELLLTIDQRLFNATEASELSDIYTSIMEFYAFLNSINNDDLQYCINTKSVIDNVLRTHLNDIYRSIEYFRQRVHDDLGKKGKFGIQWPESAKAIINSYLPGKTFDNYLPTEEE